MPVTFILQTGIGPGQIFHFSICGTVVNGCIVLVLLTKQFSLFLGVELVVPFEVFGPASIGPLVQEEGLRDLAANSALGRRPR